MKKIFLLAAPALALSACSSLPNLSAPEAPAPLAKTTIDDAALNAAWRSFDVALDAINILIDRKIITIGSPSAIKIADGIDRVVHTLTAAEKAAAAGSTTDYAVALAEAKGAITELRAALGAI